MRRVFAFDFDGTLTTTDTLIAVIRYARGTAALAMGLLMYSPMLILMKMGLYPNWKAKQRLFAHFFGGWSIGRFDSCCPPRVSDSYNGYWPRVPRWPS